MNGRVRLLAVASILILLGTAMPHANASSGLKLPGGVQSYFLMDISSSSSAQSLWFDGLRPSILKKVRQPFGYPIVGSERGKAPADVSLSLINSNSQVSPLIRVFSSEDALRMWGLIFNLGTNPTQSRLRLMAGDFFGPSGAYSRLVEKFLLANVTLPTDPQCAEVVAAAFDDGIFMKRFSAVGKTTASRELCSVFKGIVKKLQQADAVVKKANCSGNCSDIVGGIRRAVASAQDSAAQNVKGGFCLAIASDMVNNFPGMSKSSPLNTGAIVRSSSSIGKATSAGSVAAQSAGVRFPEGLPVKVYVIGQGALTSNEIPIDRLGFLDAYWTGFWFAAGIKAPEQARSVSQACKGY